jgi:hypothetical protein
VAPEVPSKHRHELYKTQRIAPVTESSVSDWILGGTGFVDPFHVAGSDDRDRFLGVQDFYAMSEGRDYGYRHADGWAFALLEMLVDPVLVSWVSEWVRERCEKMSGGVCAANHRFLLRLWRRMVLRRQQAVLRKSREGKEDAHDGSSSSSSSSSSVDRADVRPGGELECEEGLGNEVRVGRDYDAGDDEVRRVPIVHEPRPSVGEEVDGGVEERDWSRVGVEERLSAAGAAPVTADASAGAVRVGAASLGGHGRMLYNPPDYPYVENSVGLFKAF